MCPPQRNIVNWHFQGCFIVLLWLWAERMSWFIFMKNLLSELGCFMIALSVDYFHFFSKLSRLAVVMSLEAQHWLQGPWKAQWRSAEWMEELPSFLHRGTRWQLDTPLHCSRGGWWLSLTQFSSTRETKGLTINGGDYWNVKVLWVGFPKASI